MIVVKVEVWPFGDESKAREIGRATIGNVEQTASQYDLYEAEFSRDCGLPSMKARLRHHREDGFWNLLRRALNVVKFEGGA